MSRSINGTRCLAGLLALLPMTALADNVRPPLRATAGTYRSVGRLRSTDRPRSAVIAWALNKRATALADTLERTSSQLPALVAGSSPSKGYHSSVYPVAAPARAARRQSQLKGALATLGQTMEAVDKLYRVAPDVTFATRQHASQRHPVTLLKAAQRDLKVLGRVAQLSAADPAGKVLVGELGAVAGTVSFVRSEAFMRSHPDTRRMVRLPQSTAPALRNLMRSKPLERSPVVTYYANGATRGSLGLPTGAREWLGDAARQLRRDFEPTRVVDPRPLRAHTSAQLGL